MKRLMFATGLALSLPLAGCMAQEEGRPAQSAAAGRQCFNVDSVTGFNPLDRDTVDVAISRTRVYRMELSAGCEDIDFASRLAIRSRTGGRLVCSHFDAELIVPTPTGAGRCFVTDMRPLSQAEIEARRARR